MDDATELKKRGYFVGKHLGSGTFAKVRSAYCKKRKTDVAVKIINRRKVSADFLETFLPRELEILPMLDHPSIIKTYEIFNTSHGKTCIIMELADKGELLHFIIRRKVLPEDESRKLFGQLVRAVKYCHDLNIVHRDLKCENVLLDSKCNIKLTDFGFGKQLTCDGAGNTNLSRTFCGTPSYAAPEVLLRKPYQAKASDVWSLGVILFVMVCGKMPFDDDTNITRMIRMQIQHQVNFPPNKHFSSEYKDLVCRMLQPDVPRRLTVDEVLSHRWLHMIHNPGVQDTSGEQGENSASNTFTGQDEEVKATKKSGHKELRHPPPMASQAEKVPNRGEQVD
ncbi:testis-specific serine/threonine-protein kinase 1-like [Rhinophrynus dorsalis]